MTFNRSKIVKSAGANAREVHANIVRNQRFFGTPKPLRVYFAEALRETWVKARLVAARARRDMTANARAGSMLSSAKTRRIRSIYEQISPQVYPNNCFAPRVAALQSELAILVD